MDSGNNTMEVIPSHFALKPIPERVFFIVDRSKLKKETDEFKDAIVVYVPEGDLKKSNLEQRCSQLVGMSLLMLNFNSKLPKFIRLKSNGFAIKGLDDSSTFIMGLQSKYDEPQACTIEYLDKICNFFTFCYLSPNEVMKKSLYDWEIFTTQMTAIFQCILKFTFKDTHSLPSMFMPLVYISLDFEKGGTRLFLEAQRLLRNLQINKNVIGGCLFYSGHQLPPDFCEKLSLIANGGIELNSKTVLDNMQTPDKVWMVDVYLTPEELAVIHHVRRPNLKISSLYSNMSPTDNLVSNIFTQNKTVKLQLDQKSEDFVNLSYSGGLTKRNSIISPLKRPRATLTSSMERSDSPPPPLPPKPNAAPPIPPRFMPKPPPRSTSMARPQTDDSALADQWIYGDMPDTLRDAPTSPSGKYTTPTSSLPVSIADNNQQVDSDSEGFGTPPCSSPFPDTHLPLSADTFNFAHRHFLTPQTSPPTEPNKVDIYTNSLDEDEVKCKATTDDTVTPSNGDVVTSDVVTHSVIDKVIPEDFPDVGIVQEVCPLDDGATGASRGDTARRSVQIVPIAMPDDEDDDNNVEDDDMLRDRSPCDTMSESDDEVRHSNTIFTMSRPRAETWANTLEEGEEVRRASYLEKKFIYVQKCVNMVLVMLTDTELLDDQDSIHSLWKLIVSRLLQVNNDIQCCLIEDDDLYVSRDTINRYTTGEVARYYQAMYSGMTRDCEVSSVSAPYHFRHAVRRSHHEFIVNPSLRQISLCKDSCKMYCQNIMGRESYLQNTRISGSDSLMTHIMLEKQAKALSNTDHINNNGPNVTFL